MLEELVGSARKQLVGGGYQAGGASVTHSSLVKALGNFGVIAELKPKSPSGGVLFNGDVEAKAREFASNGACALSVLANQDYFGGSIRNISLAKRAGLPVLMKDFVFCEEQLDAGRKAGADAVLLIKKVFDDGYADFTLEEAIESAHGMGLEVLLETHTLAEFREAVATGADLVGINNRDLETLEVDKRNALRVLCEVETSLENEASAKRKKRNALRVLREVGTKKPVVVESGVDCREDVEAARKAGARAVLVGTSILRNPLLLKELVGCYGV